MKKSMTCPGLIGGQYAAMGHYLKKKKKQQKEEMTVKRNYNIF